MTTRKKFYWRIPGFRHRNKFPFSTRVVSGKEVRNFLSQKHVDCHKEWLVFSEVQKGLFCKYCPWFVVRCEGGYKNNVLLGVLFYISSDPHTDASEPPSHKCFS